MVDYGTLDPSGFGRPWPVNYPDDRPVWSVRYLGGEVTGTIAQPCQISVRLSDGSQPDLDGVVAADPSLPPLVRAAKAAAEHVRLFMEPHGWVGDDDEANSVVLALDLLIETPQRHVSYDGWWSHYVAITTDQLGLTFDLDRSFMRIGRVAALPLLATLMTQDRNAGALIGEWARIVSHALAFDSEADQTEWPHSDRWSVEDLATQFDGLGERERTLLVQSLDDLTRESSSPYGDAQDRLLGAWEQLTEAGPRPLGLRGRLGLYTQIGGDRGWAAT